MTLYQKAARRHAAPMLVPTPGVPLLRSTPSLGRMLEWRRGRSTVDAEMPESYRKEAVRRDTDIFIRWMEKEDGAHFRGQVRLEGPIPHLEVHQNDTQTGDAGGHREIARNLARDSLGNGKEDYIIWCLFDVPEGITEIPTDLAIDLFAKGKQNVRPLRTNDWRQQNTRSLKWSRRT